MVGFICGVYPPPSQKKSSKFSSSINPINESLNRSKDNKEIRGRLENSTTKDGNHESSINQ
jgi:hypothetical protein